MSKLRRQVTVRILPFLFVFLTAVSGVLAAPPERKLTAVVCKSDLKAWSASKTDTLAIADLNERMNVMVACADLSKKHEKQARAYLDEFYRIHAELAKRAFDFITRHGLTDQFGAEENGTPSAQSSAGTNPIHPLYR